MDKKYNREEIDNMPIPQKKEDTVFTDFISKIKMLLIRLPNLIPELINPVLL